MKSKHYYLLLTFIISANIPSNAQTTNLSAPFMAHSSNFLMTLFNLKPESVQPLLPPEIKVRVNDSGLVTAGIELYQTDRIQGVANYSIAFIFVEVEGFASNDGTPGHWVIWGRINEQATLQIMSKQFRFPYQFGDLSISKSGSNYTATVGAGLITLKVKANEQSPFTGEGIVNMCAQSEDGKVSKSEVTWFSGGFNGDLVEVSVDSRGDKVLELIKDFKPFFTMIGTNQTFCYSRPVKL